MSDEISEKAATIKLTNKERESIEWLKHFSEELLAGRPVRYQKPVVDHLKKMGITVEFVLHKEVKQLVKGKEGHYEWYITNAPWYIRGKVSAQYLPFQIKQRKTDDA